MNLRQCYDALGGDYDDVIGRMRSERLVQKFVLKFVDDATYALLVSSLDSGNTGEAFRAAHTIKGMCANLSFNALTKSASDLTEALRAGNLETGKKLFPAVTADYERTLNAILEYKKNPDAL